MISKLSDKDFKRWLDRRELTTPALLADPHYGPMMRAKGAEAELAQMRIEWRERQERARARKLKDEASFGES
ncbi:hypothetical protein NY546_09530 [Curtobacterium flaccumfaciens pv. flaccumfaciens]|uniref:hypothetical protein n=1 Tax=Curtobacterium flaccumfaciens TaxID=2035 RepID=UPI002659432B|nr:hypothetical protein [Curtobacterium flaccumfaciens]MCS5509532.1 hypothetical protein [Curtobacterium flaccumfaciens pv. flaccumfaciens]MCX2788041.1 hypothetical protein [Curtobacterium flaccumfaciens pv. flaccumfaciens]